MIIFKDFITGDELFSDAYKLKLIEDDAVYTFETKVVTRKEGQIDDSLIGGNASQEEAAEDLEDASAVSGFNFVLDNNLTEKQFMDKKDCQSFVKKLVKDLMGKIPEDKKEAFQTGSKAWVKLVFADYDDMSFYAGQQCVNADVHNIIAVKWGADGVSGTAYILRAGLVEEKC